jgi:hypothetical protein
MPSGEECKYKSYGSFIQHPTCVTFHYMLAFMVRDSPSSPQAAAACNCFFMLPSTSTDRVSICSPRAYHFVYPLNMVDCYFYIIFIVVQEIQKYFSYCICVWAGPDYPIGWIGYSLGREMFRGARETINRLAERRFFGRCTEITHTLPFKRIISVSTNLVCIIEWKFKNKVKM